MISFVCLDYGKMMKVAALFYSHDVVYDMTFCSLLKGTQIDYIPALSFVEVK
jgi:hypothetical protein